MKLHEPKNLALLNAGIITGSYIILFFLSVGISLHMHLSILHLPGIVYQFSFDFSHCLCYFSIYA